MIKCGEVKKISISNETLEIGKKRFCTELITTHGNNTPALTKKKDREKK